MLKPPIPWYGGKQKLVKDLLKYIPKHDCYVEPYGGAGALLFAKAPSMVEIYNDLHKWVVNLYTVLRDYPGGFQDAINLTPYSREEFNRCWEYLQGNCTNKLEQARCFFVIARQTFGGHHASPTWSCSKSKGKALAWINSIDMLQPVMDRLELVILECRPAIEVIKKEDGINTFQYLDPPYLHETRKETERYKYEMTDNEHFELLTIIKNLKSMFLISGYHNGMYDDMLNEWHHYDFATLVHATNLSIEGLNKKRVETIWWNNALHFNRVGEQQLLNLEVLL